MLRNMKAKALALFAVLVLAVGFLFTATPAMAAETGTLTVTSSNAAFNGKTVNAYKMFDATVAADGSVGYTLVEDWKSFFVTNAETFFGEETTITADSTLDEVSAAAYDYIRSLDAEPDGDNDTDTDLVAFARTARGWAVENLSAQKITATASQSGSNYVASFGPVGLGYYVLDPEGGSTSTERGSDAMLVAVTDANQTTNIDLKSEYPTVTKTVEGTNHASAQIGKELTFTLTSKVPDMTEFDDYKFFFTDELSAGLTFGNITSVQVGEQDLTEDSTGPDYDENSYSFSHPESNNQKIRVDINNAYTLFQNHEGETITVIYTATVNANAVEVAVDNPNNAQVNFSTNPDGSGEGSSTPSIVHTYTFGFEVNKVDDENEALAGAVFELQDANGNAISLIKDEAAYRPALTAESGVTQVTTDATGVLTFKGLAEGIYKLVEVKAPDGYNKLSKPVTITIKAEYNQNDGTLTSWGISVDKGDGQPATTVNGTLPTTDEPATPATLPEFNVENHKGVELPGTGGMGTIAFTVVGVVAVAGGVAWYASRRRSNGAHTA